MKHPLATGLIKPLPPTYKFTRFRMDPGLSRKRGGVFRVKNEDLEKQIIDAIVLCFWSKARVGLGLSVVVVAPITSDLRLDGWLWVPRLPRTTKSKSGVRSATLNLLCHPRVLLFTCPGWQKITH